MLKAKHVKFWGVDDDRGEVCEQLLSAGEGGCLQTEASVLQIVTYK